MTRLERRTASSLALIYALRMLGFFMLLPVLALYADRLAHSTPLLVGIAIGAYGLTQALLQIPFGTLSDRIGRKPVILAGLILFAVGSVVAAVAGTIYGVIAGRALQGCGAIASAVMALGADLTRVEQRTKIMAVIGISIGLSFGVAMVAGPVLNHLIGVPGIFWLTAVLAMGGVAVLQLAVPRPVTVRVHRDAEPVPAQLRAALADPQLARLYVGIFCLHLILTATFVVLPLALRDVAGLAPAYHPLVYLPVMALSILGMLPLIILGERQRRMRSVLVIAVILLGLGEAGLAELHGQLVPIMASLTVWFVGLNVLEAGLPSLVSKIAPASGKGTAMGVYSTCQFLGAFMGGAFGGAVHGAYGLAGVFAGCAVVALVWLGLLATMREPQYLSSYLLEVGPVDEADARSLVVRLMAVPGVAEAVVVADEGVAYLKVDSEALDEVALREFSVGEA